jgi:hypothetical protein
MKEAARRILSAEPDVLVREAFGLAALCSVIFAIFCLPLVG